MSKNQENKKCSKCTKSKRLTDFYKSYSRLDSDERMRICKLCIQKVVDVKDINSWKDMLRSVDKPFIVHLFESAMTKRSPIGEYFKLINAKDFRYLNWEDSTEETSIANDSDDSGKSQQSIENIHDSGQTNEINFNITQDILDKWGIGYTPEEYYLFEKKYDRLIKNYGEKTALHTEGLLSYIRFRVKEEMATAKGEVRDAKEWGALASKAATDAKINVSQLSKSDISGGVDVLSQLFEAVETEVGIIPLLPRILEQPYDDADLIIWAIINYYRRLEDKPKVSYGDIYQFYDEMLEEHFVAKGFNKDQIAEFKAKRNNVFRDLEQVYIEPLYDTGEE